MDLALEAQFFGKIMDVESINEGVERKVLKYRIGVNNPSPQTV